MYRAGRSGKQEQEQSSPNLGTAFGPSSVKCSASALRAKSAVNHRGAGIKTAPKGTKDCRHSDYRNGNVVVAAAMIFTFGMSESTTSHLHEYLHKYTGGKRPLYVQGSAKRRSPGSEFFGPAVAYRQHSRNLGPTF